MYYICKSLHQTERKEIHVLSSWTDISHTSPILYVMNIVEDQNLWILFGSGFGSGASEKHRFSKILF